jgi:hypothetical protein
VAVVPAAKTIFLASGPLVEVGWGMDVGTATVGVAREAVIVGLGGMEVGVVWDVAVVRLGGIEVGVDAGAREVGLTEVGVVVARSGWDV